MHIFAIRNYLIASFAKMSSAIFTILAIIFLLHARNYDFDVNDFCYYNHIKEIVISRNIIIWPIAI